MNEEKKNKLTSNIIFKIILGIVIVAAIVFYFRIYNVTATASLNGIYYLRYNTQDTYTDMFIEFDNSIQDNKKMILYSAQQYNEIEPTDPKMPIAFMKSTYTLAAHEANHIVWKFYYDTVEKRYHICEPGSLLILGGLYNGESKCLDSWYQELESDMPEQLDECTIIINGDVLRTDFLDNIDFIKVEKMPEYYSDLFSSIQ